MHFISQYVPVFEKMGSLSKYGNIYRTNKSPYSYRFHKVASHWLFNDLRTFLKNFCFLNLSVASGNTSIYDERFAPCVSGFSSKPRRIWRNNSVNVTRLKQEILKEVLALCELWNGKLMWLILGGNVGKALFEVTQNAHKDNGIVLSRAPKIIHKNMFDKEEIFCGDIFGEKQKDSVPSPLFHLLSLIPGGVSIRDDCNANLNNIVANIGQHIKFKTVKHDRKSSSATCHSKKINKSPLPVKLGIMVLEKKRKSHLLRN